MNLKWDSNSLNHSEFQPMSCKQTINMRILAWNRLSYKKSTTKYIKK